MPLEAPVPTPRVADQNHGVAIGQAMANSDDRVAAPWVYGFTWWWIDNATGTGQVEGIRQRHQDQRRRTLVKNLNHFLKLHAAPRAAAAKTASELYWRP